VIDHAPGEGVVGFQLAGVGELERTAQPDHLRQVVRSAVLDDLSGIVIGDEARLLAAHADVAVERHVHARADGRAFDHGDGRLADQGDVAVKLREAVIEILPRGIQTLVRAARARKVLAGTSAGAFDRRSAPAQKTRPTPVRTITRTLGSLSPARMYSPTLATVPFSSAVPISAFRRSGR
jgi:hypothetical protein